MNKYRKSIIDQPFAWPGGYERFAITDDGGVLCYRCCESEGECIDTAVKGDGWFIVAADNTSNLDEPILCDHCGAGVGGG